MAGTVLKILLVSVCLLNTNLICVQAEDTESEADYTIEIRDAKVSSFSAQYFSDKTTIYTTMYNDSYTKVDGAIDMVKSPPDEAQVMVNLDEFDAATNVWMQRGSPVPETPLCDFIANGGDAMNLVYSFSDFTAKGCPIDPGTFTVQILKFETDKLPSHIPESSFRATILMYGKNSKEVYLSMLVYADVVAKADSEDD